MKKFENLSVWLTSVEIAQDIYLISNQNAFRQDFSFKDQVRRASISISSNIAEGFESHSTKSFIRYLYIAKASSGEVRSQIYLARSIKYIDEENFLKLTDKLEKVSSQISNLIKYLKANMR